MSAGAVTASDISQALSSKHCEDVFVPECKDGPTQSSRHQRMDAWVMKRKWRHPLVIGYEIKVSRSDFLGDDKWRGYLTLCNEFYFAAPKGLIQLSELSSEAGLIELVGKSRLVVRKKAPYRDLAVPEELYRYILMARTRIVPPRHNEGGRAKYWRDWIETRAENRRLGHEVSEAIRQHVERVECDNERLKTQNESYDDVREFMKSIGLDSDATAYRWDVERRYKAAQSLIPLEFTQALDNMGQVIADLQKQIRELTSPKP